jgi:hypothetical protein
MSVTVNHLDIFLLEFDGKKMKKRVLLNPMNIIVMGNKYYSLAEQNLILTNELIVKVE